MMAHITSFGLYLLSTLLLFLSGVNHSLAMASNGTENIPRAAHPKEPSQIDRLELALQTMMRGMEDGFARSAREVGEIKEEVKSLEKDMTSFKEGVESLEKGMESSKKEIQSLEEKLSNVVDTITSSVADVMSNAVVCTTESDPTPSALTTPSTLPTPSPLPPSNCHDLLQRGHSSSGEYSVTISGKNVEVYCDMTTDGGGWTVIQKRDDIRSHVDFDRGWADYKRGFGDLNGEFWLGLDNIHGLTSDPSTPMLLRVDLEDWQGEKRVALYSTFVVQDEEEKYKISVGGYEKGPGGGDPRDSLVSVHNGRAFSTRDRDNDVYEGNCAEVNKGGWWYQSCHSANLNGVYLEGKTGRFGQGVIWLLWTGYQYSLKRAAMMIRPR